jgi:hypothetical protein
VTLHVPRLRRNPVPEDVRRALQLERGERVLVHVALADGGAAIATDRSLHLLPAAAGEEPPEAHVIPWHRVLRARWVEDDLVVLVEESAPGGPVVHRLALEEPSLLPETLRERVTASIVVSRQVKAPGGAAARVVGRRVPGSDALEWQVIRDAGAAGAEIEERIASALRDLQEQTGG